LTKVEGLEEKGLLDILSVTGTNMKAWPSANHFTSWLGLSPCRRISGGKLLGHERKKVSNPASQAFRLSAQSLSHSKGSLGDLYRRISIKHGPQTANKAVARKLAIIFYTLVKNQQEYDASLLVKQTEKQQERKLSKLKKMAKNMGYEILKTA
jgi:hypothetical protein